MVLFRDSEWAAVYAGVWLERVQTRRIIGVTRRELPVERFKKRNLWPETHECVRAREHGIEWIVIDCFKKYRVARIMSRARGQ